MKLTIMSVVYQDKIMFQGVGFTRQEVLQQASTWINKRTDINSESTTAETVKKFFRNWEYGFEIKEVDISRWPTSHSSTEDVDEAKVNVFDEAKLISQHALNAEVNARKDIIMNALGENALGGKSANTLEKIVRDTCKRLFGQVEEVERERAYFNSAMDGLVCDGLIVTSGLRLTPVSCKVGPKEHVWIKVVPTEIEIRRYCNDNFATVQSNWELKEIYPCFGKPKNVTIILSPRDVERGWKIVWRH